MIKKLQEYFNMAEPYDLEISNRHRKSGQPLTITLRSCSGQWSVINHTFTKPMVDLMESSDLDVLGIQIIRMKQELDRYLSGKD